MTLHVRDRLLPIRSRGPQDGRPVVLLHGFLADSRQWDALTDAVDSRIDVPIRWLLPDLPGHGVATTTFPNTPGWPHLNDLLKRSLQPHLRGPALLAGYSMGGRIAASLAASGLLNLRGLWLESAHPPLPEPAQAQRRAEDEARAVQLETAGLSAFVRAWEALPLFANQHTLDPAILASQRALRLSQDPHGLAQNLRWYGTGTMPTTLALHLPTHGVAGALDAKLLGRLPEWRAFALNCAWTILANAGHATHLEQLDATATDLAATIERAFS